MDEAAAEIIAGGLLFCFSAVADVAETAVLNLAVAVTTAAAIAVAANSCPAE